jgi:hypothetical protein
MLPSERAEAVLLVGGPVEGKHPCIGCGAYDWATVIAHRSDGSMMALCAKDRERLARLVNALGVRGATGPLV